MYNLAVELTQLDPSPSTVTRLVEFTLAHVIAVSLPVPAASVDNASGYFAADYRLPVNETLSRLNEQYVFNLEKVNNDILRLWLNRYHAAHDNSMHRLLNAVINGTNEYSEEEREWVKAHRYLIGQCDQILRKYISSSLQHVQAERD